MKPVPPHIAAGAPEGTLWYGGPVDRSKLTLRVMCDSSEVQAVSELLGCESEVAKHGWRLSAPALEPANLDVQVQEIFSKLTADLHVWRQVCSKYKVDLFCGLFLERPNRGISLSPETMAQVSSRGISLGFDIYGPG